MAKRKPPLFIRKPPSSEPDPASLERFVSGGKPSQTPQAPNIQSPEHSHVPTVQASDVPASRGTVQGRSLVARQDGRVLKRTTLYLPPDLARKLAVYCAEHDQEMSEVTAEALKVFLAQNWPKS